MFLLFVTAFVLMLTGFVPFEVVLIPALASSPKRALGICIASIFGSAFGAVALAGFFQTTGAEMLSHLIPSLMQTREWGLVELWMQKYGAWTLAGFSALPVAQAPVIVLAGLLQVPALSLLFAFLAGKSLKYGIISWAVVRGEQRFLQNKTNFRKV